MLFFGLEVTYEVRRTGYKKWMPSTVGGKRCTCVLGNSMAPCLKVLDPGWIPVKYQGRARYTMKVQNELTHPLDVLSSANIPYGTIPRRAVAAQVLACSAVRMHDTVCRPCTESLTHHMQACMNNGQGLTTHDQTLCVYVVRLIS